MISRKLLLIGVGASVLAGNHCESFGRPEDPNLWH